LSFEQYLVMQNQMQSLVETLEILSNAEEVQMLMASMNEVNAGSPRKSIEEIRASLKSPGGLRSGKV
jgi:hypothetical protein